MNNRDAALAVAPVLRERQGPSAQVSLPPTWGRIRIDRGPED